MSPLQYTGVTDCVFLSSWHCPKGPMLALSYNLIDTALVNEYTSNLLNSHIDIKRNVMFGENIFTPTIGTNYHKYVFLSQTLQPLCQLRSLLREGVCA